ncbi:MAG: hypothetical protein JJE21_11185 [Spirochaetaceae bacterium]|nr:hypothetical protein [Spirochaetaceae bacterium]
MQTREAVHLFRIFEDYSKQHIDFSISSAFTVPEDYYLSKKDINDILKENGNLIKAMYARDEGLINKILQKDLFNIDIFDQAQIGDDERLREIKTLKRNSYATPLPIQARYVLFAWNQLRVANLDEINTLITTLDNKAFLFSFYTKITQMALSIDSPSFNRIAKECYDTLDALPSFYLYFSLLSYHYRLIDNQEYRKICNNLSSDSKNNLSLDQVQIAIIRNDLNKE